MGDHFLANISLLAILVSAFALGGRICDTSPTHGLLCSRPLERSLLWVVCGFSVWTLALILVAWFGAFHFVPWIALLIAMLLLMKSIFWGRSGTTPTPRMSVEREHLRSFLFAAAILLALSVAYGWAPKSSLLGERDEGIYTQHALHLVNEGSSRIDLERRGVSTETAIKEIERGARPPLPGIYPTSGAWTFQFSGAAPVWMALSAMAWGSEAVFLLNSMVCALGAFLFWLLSRDLLPAGGKVFAWFGFVGFALNPVQVWVARNTLSEPLAGLFILAALLCVGEAFRREQRRAAVISGVLLGMATIVKVDSIVFLPALLAGWLGVRLIGAKTERNANDRMFRSLAVSATVSNLLALGLYAITTRPYLTSVMPQVLGALWLSAGLSLVVFSTMHRTVEAWLRPHGVRLARLSATVLVLLFVYAVLVRPHLEPFSIIESQLVPHLNGNRDYREESVHRLAAHLGWPLVCLAVVGAAALLWEWGTDAVPAHARTVLAILVPVTILYLWNPMVSPDHIWGARRWVTGVLPCVFALAGFGVYRLCCAMRDSVRRGVLLAATVFLAVSLIWTQREVILVTEDRGVHRQLAELASFVGEETIVYVVDRPTVASALLAGFKSKIVPITSEDLSTMESKGSIISPVCGTSANCMLLHPGPLPSNLRKIKPLAVWSLKRHRRISSNSQVEWGMHDTTDTITITMMERGRTNERK